MPAPGDFKPLAIWEHLDSEEMIVGYLREAAKDEDPNVLRAALVDAAKARGMMPAISPGIFRVGPLIPLASDWRPIETAPRDGTWILAYPCHERVEKVRWYANKRAKNIPPYWVNNLYAPEWYNREIDPSFWMPLPEPPK
jgi:hypothetical protein